MSLDAQGKFVFVANYAGGTIAVFPSSRADAWPGRRCPRRHRLARLQTRHQRAREAALPSADTTSPHAHMIAPAPDNRFVLATDLAQDRLYVYSFDAATGKLTPAATPFVSLPSGDGPRHFAFHPNGHWLYLLDEEASTIVFFHYDPATGALTAAEYHLRAARRVCRHQLRIGDRRLARRQISLCANRLHDTICICAIDADGSPQTHRRSHPPWATIPATSASIPAATSSMFAIRRATASTSSAATARQGC